MPTYDYECRACGNRIEVIHGMTDPGPSACDRCGGPMRRILHPAGIIFKGSGFYKTDSRVSTSGSKPHAGDGTTTASPAAGDTPATGTADASGLEAAAGGETTPKPAGTSG